MIRISRDSPCLYITSAAKSRLPVFRTDVMKSLACAALDEARKSGGFLYFAYVIMPDHLHAITDPSRKPSDVLRFVNGIVGHRAIGYLKEKGFMASLAKLREREKKKGYKYSLWEHHSNVMLLTSEATFMQKVNYIHMNPVRAGLVERAEDYRWSSVRCWRGCPEEDEPLRIDLDRIEWRRQR